MSTFRHVRLVEEIGVFIFEDCLRSVGQIVRVACANCDNVGWNATNEREVTVRLQMSLRENLDRFSPVDAQSLILLGEGFAIETHRCCDRFSGPVDHHVVQQVIYSIMFSFDSIKIESTIGLFTKIVILPSGKFF